MGRPSVGRDSGVPRLRIGGGQDAHGDLHGVNPALAGVLRKPRSGTPAHGSGAAAREALPGPCVGPLRERGAAGDVHGP